MEKKITVILSFFPVDSKSKTGGQARLTALLNELQSNNLNPHHICVYGDCPNPRTRKILEGINETWLPSNKIEGSKFLRKNFNHTTFDSASGVLIKKNNLLLNFLKKIVTANTTIIATHFWFGEIKENFSKIKFILYSHNFESDLLREDKFSGPFLNFYKVKEKKASNLFDQIYCCSKADLESYTKISYKNNHFIDICPNGTYLKKNQISRPGKNIKNVLYIGSSWIANISGVTNMIEQNPEFFKKFNIQFVGSICDKIKDLNIQNNFCLHGVLSENDLIDIANVCSFAINPIWAGGGSNVKNADYLGLGLPVLTTKFGIRGFEMYKAHITILPIGEWHNFSPSGMSIDDTTIANVQWKQCLKKLIVNLTKI